MSEVKDPQLCQVLEHYVLRARVAPAATAGFSAISATPTRRFGAAGILPGGSDVRVETIFDLASVSKPVVACTLARLARRGTLDLTHPLGEVLPDARGTHSEAVPLELFLAHRAGLSAHRSLFAPVFQGRPFHRAGALRGAANARRPDCLDLRPPPEGFAPVYSDLGYILLGAAIEAATGHPLDEVVKREITTPLGLELELGSARQLRRRQPSFDLDVAPTEVVAARGGCVRGIVHDENAWALSGHGASGHAGLFGTVAGVLGFGAALLEGLSGKGHWLGTAVLQTLLRARPGGSLLAGFDSKSETASSAGTCCGPRTFGHLGFTGTSLWCDPGAGVATALLTNRVHPSRDNPRIRAARPLVHDALFEAAKAMLPGAPKA